MNKRYMKGKWLLMLLICIAILYPIHTQAAKTAINKKNVIVLKSKTVQLKELLKKYHGLLLIKMLLGFQIREK